MTERVRANCMLTACLVLGLNGCSKYTEPGAFYDPFHPRADGLTGMVSCDENLNSKGECDAWEGRHEELAAHRRHYTEEATVDELHQCVERETAGLRKHKILGVTEWQAVSVPPCMRKGEAVWVATQVAANRIVPTEEPGEFSYYRANPGDIERIVEAAVNTQYRMWLENQP